jgi:cobalt-zinc-cadmium efflux system outer membrane protein
VQVQIAGDLTAWLDTITNYNTQRAREGAAAELDVIRSRMERDRVAAEHAMRGAELARARAALSAYVTDAFVVVAAFDTVPMPMPRAVAASPANALSPALEARPDVTAARYRLDAARASIGVERTMILPALDATLGIKRAAGSSSLLFGINAPFPLLNQNRAEIRRTSAERDAADFDLSAARLSARGELAGALEAARLLTLHSAELAAGFLARADEARRITVAAYREGGVPLLQVIDAARAWGEAREVFFETLFAQHLSVLELLVAEGNDLQAFTSASGETKK